MNNGNGNGNGFHDLREEILERVWILTEQGEATLPALLAGFHEPGTREEVKSLTDAGLLQRSGEALALTPRGTEKARRVVRANRLAARLLSDILELPAEVVERHACRLEHAIGPALADSLCTLLGHPPTAPDGRPIPPGDCCRTLSKAVAPAVCPLTAMTMGASGRVTFIHPRFAAHMDQLASLGLIPGTTLRLRQRHPAVVVELGESTLALDAEVAREIYVKPV